ncbi:MAG TPA: hypothetical protein VK550_19210 [Polyangiaceae bacterium]|nr:hypothetical protein [Polyangiaceae bacterium]
MNSLILAAILALAPSLAPETAERYASDIAIAADGDLEMAAALVATAEAESNFRAAIEQCECQQWECDRGADRKIRALGLFQLQYYWWSNHEPAEICGDSALAAILTAKELGYLQKRYGWVRALRYHIGGKATDEQVRPRIRRFEQLTREWKTAA